MNNNIQQHLPAGIESGVEVFASQNELYAIYNGSKIRFFNLPKDIIEAFREEMLQNNIALKSLVKLNLTDPNAMLFQYVKCNYGGFNYEADFLNNTLSKEYWDCGSRGTCPFEGKICGGINTENQVITKQELRFIKYLLCGLADKEIADRLGIAVVLL